MFRHCRSRGQQSPLCWNESGFGRVWAVQTHEKIVGFWAEPADFEELHHVEELAMNVPADLEIDAGK